MRTFFFFIFLCFNFSFGQNVALNTISRRLEKLNNDLPKTINNQTDFNLALTQILKTGALIDKKIVPDSDLKPFITPTKNAIIWADKNANLEDKLKCKIFYLYINVRLLNIKEVIETGTELLNYKENLTKIEVNNTLNCLTVAYKKIEAYNEIIKITPLRKLYCVPEIITIRDIDNDLALAYFKSKNYKVAAKSYLKVKEYFKVEKEYLFVSSMSNNVGLCYLKLYDYPNAKKYFKLALQELSKTKSIESKKSPKDYNNFFRSVIYSNIAKIDVANGDFNKAITRYSDLKKKALIVGGSEKYNITDAYLNISKIYLLKNNSKLAQIYLDSSKMTLDKMVPTDTQIEVLNLESTILFMNGNATKAAMLSNKSKIITDSIAQIQIGRENILAQAKYNSDEKDKELLFANSNLKYNKKISLIQKIGLSVTTFLITIIGFLYYKTYKNRKLINQQNKILKQNLHEKEILLKEVHHRVKNNLHIISGLLELQAKKTTSPEILQVLQDSERQINSIALVHQMLYQYDEFSIISMNDFFNELINQLSSGYSFQNIAVTVKVNKIHLSANKAISLGLIISELMTNTYKYAFDEKLGQVVIQLKAFDTQEIEFSFRDNGKGFDENLIATKTKTLGFRLLKMLAEEMNGQISINGQNGTLITIKFKKDEK